MFRKGRTQVGMIALAALLLGSAPAAAGQGNGSFLSWAWQWVQSIWADEGACIDPDGAPCASARADEGMHIDPNG
jgi:hypothetical protein